MAGRAKRSDRVDRFQSAFEAAWDALSSHAFFRPLTSDPTGAELPVARVRRHETTSVVDTRGWARVRADGLIEANPYQRGNQEEWLWVLTHCLLHLGFGHLDHEGYVDDAYATACCVSVARFQQTLRLGAPPMGVPATLPATSEDVLAARWRTEGIPELFAAMAVGGTAPDIAVTRAEGDVGHDRQPSSGSHPAVPPAGTGAGPTSGASGVRRLSWTDRLSIGLAASAASAVAASGHTRHESAGGPDPNSAWEVARRWFVSAYPLLAALAAGFTIVANRELAQQHHISIAAVDTASAEIYINPLAPLREPGWRFVLAHEMLHAALRHGDRVGGRDPYLWNVAADYVINDWLVEMGVGEIPDGLLYDPRLHAMSAEEVYDRIAGDLRRLRRMGTLRGRGVGDILTHPLGRVSDPIDLDAFYRRALALGLANHQSRGRGLLPAGLVEEIRVLDHPPLPWDAQLARWFDEHIPAVEKRRTYARASRRQSSTPHIPRPAWYRPEEEEKRVTFGVVLDTSGSMNHQLMGKALGAIASFSLARDVPAARVVFCDAVAYDAGYLPVGEIAGRVRVRGRGGTVLQAGIRLLERAEDFPPTGPILIITDALCDVLRVRREHAYLIPSDANLPFTARGPIFRVR